MKKFLSFILLGTTVFLAACERDTTYDEFAQCLTDEGFVFYGLFTCPHCHDQKDLFEDSIDLIDYVECHPDGKDADEARCEEAGVARFPSWEYPSGEIVEGVNPLEMLRTESNTCVLPTDSVLFQNADDEEEEEEVIEEPELEDESTEDTEEEGTPEEETTEE